MMGAKDNFSQAVKDLLYKSETDIPETAETSVQVHPAAVHVATAQPDIMRMETAAPVRTPLSDSFTTGVSTVAAGTLIIGEIHSKGDLNLLGDIQGNVETRVADAARIDQTTLDQPPARIFGHLPVRQIAASAQLPEMVLPMSQGPGISVVDLNRVEQGVRPCIA